MLDKLIKVLKEKNGGELDLQNEVYYLFFKDALFTFYLDEDTKTLKVNIEFLPEDDTKIYFLDESIEGYLEV